MRVPLLRTIQNGPRFTGLLQAQRLSDVLGDVPLWVRQPTSVQFDTTVRKCPLDCVYCNPQALFIPAVVPKPDLPLKDIAYTCDCMNALNWRVKYSHAFVNTDPLCDVRLKTINAVLKRKLHSLNLISTNGVSYGRRYLLRDKNLNDVCFTISAVTPETYEKVHGKPLFHMALKTLCWLQHNKLWNQRISLRFIAFKENLHELNQWRSFFSEFPQEVRPLHYGSDRTASGELVDVDPEMERLYWLQQEKFRRYELPCNCFHNLTIGYDGSVMQCCDLPYKYNWGHISEVDLGEVWRKRLQVGLRHEGCRGCNQVNRNWKELFEKYVW